VSMNKKRKKASPRGPISAKDKWAKVYSTDGTWADVLLSRKELDGEVDMLAADERVLAAMLAAHEEFGDLGMICGRAFPETKSIPEKYNVHQWHQITSEFRLRFREGRLRPADTLREKFSGFFRHESSVKPRG
jgi:hypothetical protein